MNNSKNIQNSKLSTDARCDAIGNPDPVSNLRPIRFYVPEKETELEKLFRIERHKVQEWNNEFWTKHNYTFRKEKEEFHKKYVTEGSKSNQSDKISVFYKDFLDRNWKTHRRYNMEWYRKNIYLSSLALRVNVSRFLRYLKF
ncbi:COA8 family protein CG14806, mitochondrial [Planococcus citri]|uniref:COA8 family protein CG14806, mitochondrial n=1 Tax=Planococcus citri TaxID=170843 RepID=UPI0031F854FF